MLPFLFDVLQCLAVLVGSFLAFNALRDVEGEKQMSQVQLEVHDNVLRAGTAVFLQLACFTLENPAAPRRPRWMFLCVFFCHKVDGLNMYEYITFQKVRLAHFNP